MVISTRNPVHSVLYLVLVFGNMAGLLLLLEVEFIGMILLVVYVGAVAVLFLFVVMMLVPREREMLRRSGLKETGLGIVTVCVVIALWMLVGVEEHVVGVEGTRSWMETIDKVSNIEEVGQVLYTVYFYNLIVAGFVLLVAMIGAIVLTMPRRVR